MKLKINHKKIRKARELARMITRPVQEYIEEHTTISIERASLRLCGSSGATTNGEPIPNTITRDLSDKASKGLVKYYINALIQKKLNPDSLNQLIKDGFKLSSLPLVDFKQIQDKANQLVDTFASKIQGHNEYRRNKIDQYKNNENDPLLYVIVATGNVYEDVKQARAAAIEGSDIIAVIRSTVQSLLDYVPEGPTTEGFGGTYATQANFKIMREALDDVGKKENKYIRLVNYASGLCMPEIAVMGALERLDMMLSDSMYGVLFRDINMYRTFVDQHFSRMLHAYAEIVINTGEDNYLTTSNAYDKIHTVLASQFINERFALNSGMPRHLIGLGHAFEIDPSLKNGFLYELAHAQLVRDIFPEHPLKYMPPTKYMTGDIFKGYVMNSLFNFVGKLSSQKILLLGMLTEGIHTPFLQDRYLAIENAKYIINNICDLNDELVIKENGIIQKRANEVLDNTLAFLEKVSSLSLFNSIEEGLFAEIKRKKTHGKGFKGVLKKDVDYFNPFEQHMKKILNMD